MFLHSADATAPMHLTMKPEAAAAIVANFRSDFLKTLNTLLRAYTSKGIYPILNVSNSIHKLHPDPRDRTREKLLGGLMNVTKVEFLESLPENDPRRNGLATIVYPDSERRAELDRNLKALDKYFYPLTDIRTREVYETVARLGFDEKAIFENEVMTSSEIIPVLEEVDRRRDELLSWASLAERRIFNGIFMYLDFDFRPPDLGEDEDEYEDDDF